MIASLRGTLIEKNLDEAIVEVQGVGFRVFISLVTQSHLPGVGENVFLRCRTIVREDALDLYGFLHQSEEKLFVMLMEVSGVGPKAAMNLLSGMEPGDLASAIARGDAKSLTAIKGVGKKTAERIVLELKDKVTPLLQSGAIAAGNGAPAAKESSPLLDDLVGALTGMGYKSALAEKLAQGAIDSLGKESSISSLLKEALKLSRK